jgi:hypothetical protein
MSAEPQIDIRAPLASAAERHVHEVFCAEAQAAMVELAHHYRFDVLSTSMLREPTDLTGHQVAAIIGFAGPGLGGTLAMRAPAMVVMQCLPLDVSDPEVHVLGDWMAELTNQLLGRTKNKLIRCGATLQITHPTHAVADSLIVLRCDRARTSWIAIETTAGPLLVMVELHVAADFEFHAPAADAVVAHAEGELLLF